MRKILSSFEMEIPILMMILIFIIIISSTFYLYRNTERRNIRILRVSDQSIHSRSDKAIEVFAKIGKDTYCNKVFVKNITREFLERTFLNNQVFVNNLDRVMMESGEAVVKYMALFWLH
jgi:hypothetical protein